MSSSKVIRLVDYLTRFAFLRSKIIRDVDEYERVLWIGNIPSLRGCFTQAWGRNEEVDRDVWVEVQTQREPELPAAPSSCKDWIDHAAIRNKADVPDLLQEITRQVPNDNWDPESDQPEVFIRTERLIDNPGVQTAWNQYLDEYWLPWVDAHNEWERIHKVYSKLFAIYQEQLRLGEEYELVLSLGLLIWHTPNGHRIRRHLLVANASLGFEARLGRFTVRPSPDGASLRAELDMLDEEQPARAESAANATLGDAGDDPWEKGCIDGTLEALVHSISAEGEYNRGLEPSVVKAPNKPIVQYAPALILRKRSTRGLTQALKRIKERIENGEGVPAEFEDLAEVGGAREVRSEEKSDVPGIVHDGPIFFPKPANEEQRQIVEKLRGSGGVLVQGPPGTGKSHTIANLICHLLATGHRILITAKTPRALKVLETLVPSELRPLCINLLGGGLEERRSLESSVYGILGKMDEWQEDWAARERENCEDNLRKLRENKSEINRRLRSIREAEIHSYTVGEGRYVGTAARIAEAVNRDRQRYSWFVDDVTLDQPCTVNENQLWIVLDGLRKITPEKKGELSLTWPATLASSEELSALFEQKRKAKQAIERYKTEGDQQVAESLADAVTNDVEQLATMLSNYISEYRRILATPSTWLADAVRDTVTNSSSLWRELHRATEEKLHSIEPLVTVADESTISVPDGTNTRVLLDDVWTLREHLKGGGKLGWGPFRAKVVKDRRYVLDTALLNGRPCLTAEELSVMENALRVQLVIGSVWELWGNWCEKAGGPYAMQLHSLKALNDRLESVLSLETIVERGRSLFRKHPSLSEPSWDNEGAIDALKNTCELALAIKEERAVIEKISALEAPLLVVISGGNAHSIAHEALRAIRGCAIEELERCRRAIGELEKERQRVQYFDETRAAISRVLPHMLRKLEGDCWASDWESRIADIQNAWSWAQARYWVEEYIRQDDDGALSQRIMQIGDEIDHVIARLASLHAWSFCFKRLEEPHRRHMEAWQQSMRRVGRGTGRHAARHRREAQLHLNQCREAVPAWVMPLHRIWDTVDPAPGMFDVVIVDEASQCGVEALPLLYLGKKVLIVGDDKQISPDAVGLPRDRVHRLMEEYLDDFQFKSTFDVESSLFDHGKLRYGTRRITLREHFRCMPEIIRFSNDLCYADTPLIPLRQYGTERLSPLERVFVPGGYREGSGSHVINPAEADAVTEKILELCADEKYEGREMGVVVLQGEAQARLIETQLLDRLGAEEMERRRLVCGNPYSFQGDERHVMFLSMVAAANERIGAFVKPADERRFNVAASRACDQMFLFHSVRKDDLSTACLRRRLLEFFEDMRPVSIAGIEKQELERRAAQDNRSIVQSPPPFESWFEVDVALEIVRKGFQVVPQYEIAHKRIDLLVQGGRARLAVECDGDRWHGPDKYEEDMQRQRQLERCGLKFFRVRESAFYLNKEDALARLWDALEKLGIRARFGGGQDKPESDAVDSDDYEDDIDVYDDEAVPELEGDEVEGDRSSGRRPDDIQAAEIQDTIVRVLSLRPHQSCTIDSITGRVLKDLNILTRGNPRLEFGRRVMRALGILERKGVVEKYKAKNHRIRLCPSFGPNHNLSLD